jgi:acetyl esterase/lipase
MAFSSISRARLFQFACLLLCLLPAITAQSSPTDAIFDPFNVYNVTYKTVHAHPIEASVLIPKNLKAGTYPVAVNIHGGFFIAADRLFPSFFPQWLMKLAVDNGAIIVSADYRLFATPHGLEDVNSDLEDFWTWTRGKGLKSAIAEHAPGYQLDFGKTLVTGGSAGGYGAAQLALSHTDDINLLALFYPMVDVGSSHWRNPLPPNTTVPLHVPTESLSSLEDTKATIKQWQKAADAGAVITEAGMDRFLFGASLAVNGLFWKLFDPLGKIGRKELPMDRLRAGGKFPKRVWVAHGTNDSAVPISESEDMVKVLERKECSKVVFDVEEGADHGFDGAWDLNSEDIRKKLKWVMDGWRGKN